MISGWTLFIARVFGIRVGVHLSMLAYLIFWLANTSGSGFGTLSYLLTFLGILYTSILLHEFGHALACKLFKGDADEILIWPLGGLAKCLPPFHPTAHLATSIGGPLVSLFLWLFFWMLTKVVPLTSSLSGDMASSSYR